MKDFWDNRYNNKEFAYGEKPNLYFKKQLEKLEPGKILFPAEGEGRNAVYAAKLGHEVSAFDISESGKTKAEILANSNNVKLNYTIGELPNLNYKNEAFDAIVCIYTHFPANIKNDYFNLIEKKLKKGGFIIFEGFSKNNLKLKEADPDVGGPSNIEVLFSIEEINTYFKNYEIIELKEEIILLNEGLYHKGKGSVVRFFGRKK
ncbi:class I SAM-dependent methyltransferase [Neotamlana laminarinivorans]|uniref:Methyltransferase domain-containing protein n=1 Tax=Neotamlana laminarinivorans TaxID=2883124 RepID=A0A9X1HWW2_9FLAO|nr:class I SAM-dependent methyltransferase [Tamlana laminarinivorans]MCB4797629.1 methyltransferase domain-containing protein [Tamlana laminarinivorans]